jgi:GPI mannosyltransferase 3
MSRPVRAFSAVKEWWRSARARARSRRSARLTLLDQRHCLPVWAWMALWLVLAVATRLAFGFDADGSYHPDEVFQYLEPAHWLIDRHALLAWEFRDGARNWFLPWHYASLLKLASWLDLQGLARLDFVRTHNAIAAALVVPAAFRIGHGATRRVDVGVLAAGTTALLPLLGFFGTRTLAEVHCLVFLSWATASWVEQAHDPAPPARDRRSFWVGLLFGAAVIARANYVVGLPLVAIDYLVRRRFAQLAWLCGGFFVALAALGAADAFTWQYPFQSLIVWFRFNIIDGLTSPSNLKPVGYYFYAVFRPAFGVLLYPLLLAMLAGSRSGLRPLLAWAWPVLFFTLISNKQERFLLPIWPCFAASAAIGVTYSFELLEKLRFRHRERLRPVLVFGPPLFLSGVLAVNAVHVTHAPRDERRDVFRAADWVRRQKELTGLALLEKWTYTGGYTVLDRKVPVVLTLEDALTSRLISHVIASSRDDIQRILKSRDYEQVKAIGEYRVFRRKKRWIR